MTGSVRDQLKLEVLASCTEHIQVARVIKGEYVVSAGQLLKQRSGKA